MSYCISQFIFASFLFINTGKLMYFLVFFLKHLKSLFSNLSAKLLLPNETLCILNYKCFELHVNIFQQNSNSLSLFENFYFYGQTPPPYICNTYFDYCMILLSLKVIIFLYLIFQDLTKYIKAIRNYMRKMFIFRLIMSKFHEIGNPKTFFYGSNASKYIYLHI